MKSLTAQHPPAGASPAASLPAGRWRGAFVAGACAPSWPALLAALVVCVGWLVVCAWYVTPQWVVRHVPLLTTGRRDEFPQLAARALRLRLAGPHGEPAVILVGDSSLREAVTSEADLSGRLGARAVLLAAGGVTSLDQVAIADQLITGHVRGTVVLEISPYDLALDPVNVRRSPADATHDFPFDSDARRQELRRMGVRVAPRTHNFLLDGRRFFASRIDRFTSLHRDTYTVHQHLFDGQAGWTEREWKGPGATEKVCRWQPLYRRNRAANFALYGRLLSRLRAAGLRPCLVRMIENPRNGRLCGRRGQKLRREYEDDLRRFAAAQRVPLIEHLESDAHLTPVDFGDYVHVRTDAARQRYTACLADALRGKAIPRAMDTPPVTGGGDQHHRTTRRHRRRPR